MELLLVVMWQRSHRPEGFATRARNEIDRVQFEALWGYEDDRAARHAGGSEKAAAVR